MKFQEITEKEYREFWENHPLKTFLSAPEISKLRQKSNWDTYYVGVKENKKLIYRHLNMIVITEFLSTINKSIDKIYLICYNMVIRIFSKEVIS